MVLMNKYILGYLPEDDMGKLVEFENEEKANWESEEWLVVYTTNIEAAREKYEKQFQHWQKAQKDKQ